MKYGDIEQLGRHRLMCGDASNPAHVARLLRGVDSVDMVLTDPPYGNAGTKLQKNRGGIGGNAIPQEQMLNNNDTSAARKNYEILKKYTDNFLIFGGNYFTDFLPSSPGWIFWNKRNQSTDFGDGELCWSSKGTKIKMYDFLWNGYARQGRLALNPRPRIHPTQKPVELFMELISDYGYGGPNIVDCFAGSGTTLIAAELSFKNCYCMELSEKHCNAIKERFLSLTRLA